MWWWSLSYHISMCHPSHNITTRRTQAGSCSVLTSILVRSESWKATYWVNSNITCVVLLPISKNPLHTKWWKFGNLRATNCIVLQIQLFVSWQTTSTRWSTLPSSWQHLVAAAVWVAGPLAPPLPHDPAASRTQSASIHYCRQHEGETDTTATSHNWVCWWGHQLYTQHSSFKYTAWQERNNR